MLFELPKLEPTITKDFLLSKNSEETYMSTYLGIPVKKGLLISPLRNDKKPTASFYRNKKGDLIFHDFGIGFHGNFISVVMFRNNCNYAQALQIIAEDFGYVSKKVDRPPIKIKQPEEIIDEKPETYIQVEPQPFSDSELNWWKSFGISLSTLNKFKVISCKSVFLNGHYLTSSDSNNFIFGYYGGKKQGIELWRIYFPRKRVYRFLGNYTKHYIQGAKQLPSSGDLLVCTKSLKDCMCLYELGINAIAPCSEMLFLTNYQLSKLKSRFKNIIVIYDNDKAGIKGLNKIKKEHPKLKYFFIPRSLGAKDISDYFHKYGKEKTIEGIEQAKRFLQI